MLNRSRAARILAPVALAVTASLASVATASAESSNCWWTAPKVWDWSCDTGTVKANPRGHFVFFEASPNAHYTLKDETTHVVLRSDTASWRGKHETVFGLYGMEYRLSVDGPPVGYGYLSNS